MHTSVTLQRTCHYCEKRGRCVRTCDRECAPLLITCIPVPHSDSLENIVHSQPVSYTHLDVYKRQYTHRLNLLQRINSLALGAENKGSRRLDSEPRRYTSAWFA